MQRSPNQDQINESKISEEASEQEIQNIPALHHPQIIESPQSTKIDIVAELQHVQRSSSQDQIIEPTISEEASNTPLLSNASGNEAIDFEACGIRNVDDELSSDDPILDKIKVPTNSRELIRKALTSKLAVDCSWFAPSEYLHLQKKIKDHISVYANKPKHQIEGTENEGRLVWGLISGCLYPGI